jgi:hypothetical protein
MSSDVVTPLNKQKKDIDPPIVDDKLNLPRKIIRNVTGLFTFYWKKVIYRQGRLRGNKIVHHCEGKINGFCPFEVIWSRCIINGDEFWYVSYVNLSHTGCIFTLKKPSLKLLLEDEDMVSLAYKTKNLPDIISHGKSSKELTIHPKPASTKQESATLARCNNSCGRFFKISSRR